MAGVLRVNPDYSLEYRRKVLPYKNPADFEPWSTDFARPEWCNEVAACSDAGRVARPILRHRAFSRTSFRSSVVSASVRERYCRSRPREQRPFRQAGKLLADRDLFIDDPHAPAIFPNLQLRGQIALFGRVFVQRSQQDRVGRARHSQSVSGRQRPARAAIWQGRGTSGTDPAAARRPAMPAGDAVRSNGMQRPCGLSGSISCPFSRMSLRARCSRMPQK